MERRFRNFFVEEFNFDNAVEFVTALAPWNPIWSEHGAPSRWLFRGQRSLSWQLLPSAHRGSAETTSPETTVDWMAERDALVEFVRVAKRRGLWVPPAALAMLDEFDGVDYTRSVNHFMWQRTLDDLGRNRPPTVGEALEDDGLFPPSELWETLALAQHHGLATRLLDWTRSSYVAAFFASEHNDGAAERLAVWAFDRTAALAEHSFSLSVYEPPTYENRNAAAQAGAFTILRQRTSRDPLAWDLEGFLVRQGFKAVEMKQRSVLRVLSLDPAANEHLQTLLHRAGVGPSTVYPSYDGVAMEVSRTAMRSQARFPISPAAARRALDALVERELIPGSGGTELVGATGRIGGLALHVVTDGTDKGPHMPAKAPGRRLHVPAWSVGFVRVARTFDRLDVIVRIRPAGSLRKIIRNGSLHVVGHFEIVEVTTRGTGVYWAEIERRLLEPAGLGPEG